jgi:hypothetical protein
VTPCPACGQTHGLGDRNRPKMSDAVPMDPRPFPEYAGRYRFPDFNVEVTTDGKSLRVQYDGAGPFVTLGQLRDGEFTAAEIPDFFVFRRDAAGRVDALIASGDVGVRVR